MYAAESYLNVFHAREMDEITEETSIPRMFLIKIILLMKADSSLRDL